MSRPAVPVQKPHASGSWRVVRSMAVPASVKSVHANESLTTHLSGSRKIQKIEEESVLLMTRKTPGYFETVDPAFSKR